MVKWDGAYKDKGLVILDLFDGSKDKDLKVVEEHLKDKNVAFPVAWDAGGATTRQYGIMAFPTAYLIGVDGKVLWEGPPLRKIPEIEALIEKELEKVKPPKKK